MDIKKVFVIGSGTMGSGIAQQVATSGLEVILYDISTQQLEKAKINIEKSIQKSVQKERISLENAENILSNISYSTEYTQINKS